MAEAYTKVRNARSMGGEKRNHRYASMPRGELKELKDGTHSPYVYDIPTDTQKYDLGRMRYDSVGSKGYSKEAFRYDY